MSGPGDRLRERSEGTPQYNPIPGHPAPDTIPVAGPPRSTTVRSIFAVVGALVANAVLSLGVDQLLHVLAVYPPWGQPMHEPGLNFLALSYRLVFGVGAGWLVARLAPRAPIGHALILGVIAAVLSTIGAVGAITRGNLGPAWYPIALAVLAFPSVRLGAEIHVRGLQRRQAGGGLR